MRNYSLIGALAAAALVFALVAVLGTHHAMAAEYCGDGIDGQVLAATACSYGTSRYYDMDVVFEGDEVIVMFQRGGRLRLALDEEEIHDPHSSSTYAARRTCRRARRAHGRYTWDMRPPQVSGGVRRQRYS
jgi:hypothetical protein